MSKSTSAAIIVAGHVCLDVIPTLPATCHDLATWLVPGGLVNVGPMTISTGGAVSNTGLALHRLGVPVRLMGKVGDDTFGRATLDVFRSYDPALADGMLIAAGEYSSYTIIFSSPHVDRTFLHYAGPNDTFCAADVPDAALENAVCSGAHIFHFGYPTLMRNFYRDAGQEFETLLRRVKAHNLITSLDVSRPDPHAEAGKVDWPAWLVRVLPQVDVFLPSVEEALLMVDPARYAILEENGEFLPQMDGDLLSDLAGRLVGWGAAVVGLKLGSQGIYLRTTPEAARLRVLGECLGLGGRACSEFTAGWTNRELLAPAFRANLVGTTGAGDCAIAGFLTGLLHKLSPEATLTGAVAVGACNVEAADAVSGVPSWEAVQQRIKAGWMQLPVTLKLAGWGWAVGQRLWLGPHDHGGQWAARS
ncbi:MAG TPA: carbohydrate kinase family protein [Anaerolineae bacterium]|nr:carbohydrate kinase family protein [Anaerolineae bacterium]HQK14350.1 carbohydrate kinase family protein [Anaerolineae bacterium]